jgi:hypothetical protein
MPHIICFHAVSGNAGVSPADCFLYQFPGKIGDLSPLFSFSYKEPPRRLMPHIICFHAVPGNAGVSPADYFLY